MIFHWAIAVSTALAGGALIWISGRLFGRRAGAPRPPGLATAAEQIRYMRLSDERDDLRRALVEALAVVENSRDEVTRLRREVASLKERTPRLTPSLLLDVQERMRAVPPGDLVDSLSAELDLERAAHSQTQDRLREMSARWEGRSCGTEPGDGGEIDEHPTPRDLRAPVVGASGDPAIGRALGELDAGESDSPRLGVIGLDGRDGVLFLSEGAERLTGWSNRESRGKPLGEVLVLSPESTRREIETARGSGARSFLLHRRGHRIPVEVQTAPLGPSSGTPTSRAVFVFDRSEERLTALQLARQTRHDALTGLLNRGAFVRHLGGALEARSSRPGSDALCLLDLDYFRLVNDTCGHDAGDALLEWMSAILREGTSEADVIARTGEDEFAILFRNRSAAEAGHLVRLIQKKLSALKFSWDSTPLSVSASAGLVALDGAIADESAALFAAGMALRRGKTRGRGLVHEHRADDADVQREVREMRCAASMAHDLMGGRFTLFGQRIHPLSNPRDDRLRFEVLLRALDASDRPTPPVDVIRAAETYGGMAMLDRWVVRQTLKLLRAQSPEFASRLDLCSINLSSLSFRSDDLLEFIHEQVAESRIPANKLCFEITETVAMEDLGRARWLIEGLRAIGCRFALDDFGTGLASYGYLKELPVDFIKIDAMFTRDLSAGSLNRAIVESVSHIGGFLGVATIAEGISNTAALLELEHLGLDFGQGFSLSYPQPLDELIAEFLAGDGLAFRGVTRSQPPPVGPPAADAGYSDGDAVTRTSSTYVPFHGYPSSDSK